MLTDPPLPMRTFARSYPLNSGPSFPSRYVPHPHSAVLTPPTCPVRPPAAGLLLLVPWTPPRAAARTQGPSSAPRFQTLIKPRPGPHLQGPHTTRGVLQLGRPPARGRGGLPPPGPPSPLVRSRDDPCPSAHWMGRREASCPPGLPAGRQVSLQPPSPLPPTPRVHLHPGSRLREGGAGPAWLWVGAGRPLL